MNHWVKGLALIASISTISVMATSPALASSGGEYLDPADGTRTTVVAERVIFKLDQDWFDPALSLSLSARTSSVTVVGPARPIPADEQPRVGETVLVQYADATVVHQAITLACTVTTSAGTPYKYGSTVRADTSYYQSGCSGITRAQGDLDMYFAFEWRNQLPNSSSGTAPRNGQTYYWGLVWHCTNTNNSPFHSTVSNQYPNSGLYIINVSNQANLACGW